MLEVANLLDSAALWVIFSHAKPDGDSIGSGGALFEAGLARGKRVRWFGTDPVPPNFYFLPHVSEYTVQKEYKFDGEDGLYVFLDSANEDRGVEGLRERSPNAVVLNIDHHEDNSRYGTLNCVDSKASSTSEILWRILTVADWPITAKIAECLYTGAVSDTGWFAFNNTSPSTHLMAAELLSKGVNPPRIDSSLRHSRSLEGLRLWGVALTRVTCWGEGSQFVMTWLTRRDFADTNAIDSDTAMLVNQLLTIRGARFAVLLTEESAEYDQFKVRQIKVNFRSKEGIVSAALVARALDGGGHPRAAGTHLDLPLGEAIQVVQETVDKAYAEWILADR